MCASVCLVNSVMWIAWSGVPVHLVQGIAVYRGPPRFKGRRLWTMNVPQWSSLAVSPDGAVYGTAPYLCCVHTLRKDQPVRSWGTRGHGLGQFLHPCAIAVAPTREVVVSDVQLHRVQVFDAHGTYLRCLSPPPELATRWNSPHHLAVSESGHVAVVTVCDLLVFCLEDGTCARRMNLRSDVVAGVVYVPRNRVRPPSVRGSANDA